MRKQKDAFLVPLDPAAGSSILSHRPIPSLAVTTAAAAVHATSRPEVDSAEGPAPSASVSRPHIRKRKRYTDERPI